MAEHGDLDRSDDGVYVEHEDMRSGETRTGLPGVSRRRAIERLLGLTVTSVGAAAAIGQHETLLSAQKESKSAQRQLEAMKARDVARRISTASSNAIVLQALKKAVGKSVWDTNEGVEERRTQRVHQIATEIADDPGLADDSVAAFRIACHRLVGLNKDEYLGLGEKQLYPRDLLEALGLAQNAARTAPEKDRRFEDILSRTQGHWSNLPNLAPKPEDALKNVEIIRANTLALMEQTGSSADTMQRFSETPAAPVDGVPNLALSFATDYSVAALRSAAAVLLGWEDPNITRTFG